MKIFLIKQAAIIFAAVGIFLIASNVSAQQAKCYNYQETDSSVSGKIEREKVAKKNVIWILRLPKPACFDGGMADGVDVPEKNVSRLQLVLMPEEYKKYQSLVNKNVVVKGSFFHSHTAHHYTKVLLDVETIEPNR